MKERPIIFSGPMVRALLAGTKTQTRRVVKPQPFLNTPFRRMVGDVAQFWERDAVTGAACERRCPYGQPGDRLWVRETWQAFFDDEVPAERHRGPRHTLGQPARADRKSFVFYKADGPGPVHPDGFQALWRSPIHLPRKYSRITLEITGVRVERLQDISEADAIAEGAPWAACGAPQEGSHKAGFAQLWESINGPGSWDANLWVWVVEFKRLHLAGFIAKVTPEGFNQRLQAAREAYSQ